MNIAAERKRIELTLDNYRAQIDAIPDELFTETPPGGGWSYAEVYSHILQATLGACIAMERCTSNNCKPEPKGLNLIGRFVMLAGRFPPVRIKVPESVTARMPALKIDKEEAKNLLVKCRKRINDLAPNLIDASMVVRHRHPRLGAMNAEQWFKFIRIHLEHHIKQLQRIRKKLKANETF
jgi:hypothetical protein